MSLSASRANLLDAMKDLRHRWDRIREHWDDPVSRDIEEKFLDPLEPRLRNAAHAMSHMGELLARADQECRP